MQVLHRTTGAVLWEGEKLRLANLRRLDLAGADLSGLDLSGLDLHGARLNGADLRGACLAGSDLNSAYLSEACLDGATTPNGQVWEDWLASGVRHLCFAGGASLADLQDSWTCHSWDNCPMATAFGVHSIHAIPEEHRLNATFFVAAFDAGLVPVTCLEEGAVS